MKIFRYLNKTPNKIFTRDLMLGVFSIFLFQSFFPFYSFSATTDKETKSNATFDTLDPANQTKTQMQGQKNYFQAGNVELAKWKIWLVNYSNGLAKIYVADRSNGFTTLRKALGAYCHSSEATEGCYIRFKNSSANFDTQLYESLVSNQVQQQHLESVAKTPLPSEWNALPDKATITPVSKTPEVARAEAKKKGIQLNSIPYTVAEPPRPEQYYKTEPNDPTRIYINPATQQPVVDEKSYKLALKKYKEDLPRLKKEVETANQTKNELLDKEAIKQGKNKVTATKIEPSDVSLNALEESYRVLSGQLNKANTANADEAKNEELSTLPEESTLPKDINQTQANQLADEFLRLNNSGESIVKMAEDLDTLGALKNNSGYQKNKKRIAENFIRKKFSIDWLKKMYKLNNELLENGRLPQRDEQRNLNLYYKVINNPSLLAKIFKSDQKSKNATQLKKLFPSSRSIGPSTAKKDDEKTETKKSNRKTANSVIDVHVNLPAFEANQIKAIKEEAHRKKGIDENK